MKSTIGVYDTHEKALEAIKKLKDNGFPVKQLSLIGKTETEAVDEQMNVMPKEEINITGVTAGTAIGATLGILTGVGLFAIPGLGFLFGAGALVGAIAGFDFGLIGGGIASVLTTVGVKNEAVKKYQKEIEEGKFLVVAQGSDEEVKHANEVLNAHGTHTDMAIH
ncbi:MAG TPA: general stress protein [Flavipsychrobacter sp.]|nr:general stress protein [Flavipsychrobacter sp.]